jgi:intracellular multiplication protein IcmJ
MSIKLSLSGELNNWEKFKARKKNQAFLTARNKILARDHETCKFCGYQGRALEVINYDNNYSNNKPGNLITACVFCARCTLLDSYKLNYEGGDRIIYLPEMSQTSLNTLCRVLFVEAAGEMTNEGAYNAKAILAQLLDRATLLDKNVGATLSHPGLFLFYLHSEKKNPAFVSKLRWLPDPREYAATIEIWQAEADLKHA